MIHSDEYVQSTLHLASLLMTWQNVNKVQVFNARLELLLEDYYQLVVMTLFCTARSRFEL